LDPNVAAGQAGAISAMPVSSRSAELFYEPTAWLVAATVAALAQISGAAPAGSTANVVDADVSLVKPLPCTEQFGKRGQAVPPSLSETTHGPWH
jgi:hypothetical protein